MHGVRHRFTKRDANDNNDFLFREWCLTPNYSQLHDRAFFVDSAQKRAVIDYVYRGPASNTLACDKISPR